MLTDWILVSIREWGYLSPWGLAVAVIIGQPQYSIYVWYYPQLLQTYIPSSYFTHRNIIAQILASFKSVSSKLILNKISLHVDFFVSLVPIDKSYTATMCQMVLVIHDLTFQIRCSKNFWFCFLRRNKLFNIIQLKQFSWFHLPFYFLLLAYYDGAQQKGRIFQLKWRDFFYEIVLTDLYFCWFREYFQRNHQKRIPEWKLEHFQNPVHLRLQIFGI